jgi:vacuolar-type H+-ATPase subunit E/Vma4
MAEYLEQLLTRINDGYLKQAENEKDALLAASRDEAAAIINQAKEEAGKILEDTAAEAEAVRARYAEDLKRASRDSVRELRGELQRLLLAAVGKNATEAMTPAFMADIIQRMSETALQDNGRTVSILTNTRNVEALRKLIPGTIRTEIKAGEFKGGLQVSFDDSGEYFDFSENAVYNFFREHLGRELNKILDENP